jgi:hypothetical protein
MIVHQGFIVGKFRGWKNGSVFVLNNGQKVKQTSAIQQIVPLKDGPRASLVKNGVTLFLEVEGMNQKVQVIKLDEAKEQETDQA